MASRYWERCGGIAVCWVTERNGYGDNLGGSTGSWGDSGGCREGDSTSLIREKGPSYSCSFGFSEIGLLTMGLEFLSLSVVV